MERKNPASQPHACFFLYPKYGFCVSMGPPEKALLLLLLTTKSNEPNTRYLEHFIQGHMQPVPFLDPTAECVFLRALCLCPPGKRIPCALPGGSCVRRTASGLQPPHLQVLTGAPNRSQHTEHVMLCPGKAKPCPSKFLFPYRGIKPLPPFCCEQPWHRADIFTPAAEGYRTSTLSQLLLPRPWALCLSAGKRFACSMHRCTCPAISLSFSALVTAATA